MILMRTLRKDYQRYSKDDDLDDIERDLGDEYGWKQVNNEPLFVTTFQYLFVFSREHCYFIFELTL